MIVFLFGFVNVYVGKLRSTVVFPPACKPGWTGYSESCYQVVHEQMTKGDATKACQTTCKGCELVQVLDEATAKFITGLAKRPS